MKILIASSEVAPFAKTGGLADVCGSLPRALSALGHDVSIIMPGFRSVSAVGAPIEETGYELSVEFANRKVNGKLLKTLLPQSQIPVYLVDQPHYFDRSGIYGESGSDYEDNSERFVFFCRAVLDAARDLNWRPDVIHCNDWQTGLIPAYLKLSDDYLDLGSASSLLTIHNLAYQGSFWHWDMLLTGLDWKHFNWQQMEFFGQLNFLKTGIVFADELNTVSQKYAEEIQQSELGCGLDGVLRSRSDRLRGIVNGIDVDEWNPATDEHLAEKYSIETWQTGKKKCKQSLLSELGLPDNESTPLIGLVGRLAGQKGWSLIIEVLRHWLHHHDVSWVILGTGEPQYHEALSELAAQYPNRLAIRLEFSDQLAHQIEAGADIFLMASRYEPCGLNQLYSLRYGTVPVVRDTGGLCDTIVDANPQSMAGSTANGFKFSSFSVDDLESALVKAIRTYLSDKPAWRSLVETGMRQDWSWTRSASKYESLYRSMIQNNSAQSQPV